MVSMKKVPTPPQSWLPRIEFMGLLLSLTGLTITGAGMVESRINSALEKKADAKDLKALKVVVENNASTAATYMTNDEFVSMTQDRAEQVKKNTDAVNKMTNTLTHIETALEIILKDQGYKTQKERP